MRVLVAGAGGLLGLPTVRALAAAGHDVVGLVRSAAKAPAVEAAGGQAVVGDVLVADTLRRPMEGVEAVIHLAGKGKLVDVRVRGCGNLLLAAKAAHVRRFVVGSGYWLYGDQRGTIREDTPPKLRTANLEAEELALEASNSGRPEVLIVRPGMVYGNGGWFLEMVRGLRGGTYRYVGDGSNLWSPIHPADVGEAYRVILELGRPREVYLPCDDEPVPVQNFADFIANRMRVPRPEGMSMAEAERVLGRDVAQAYAANQAATNARVRALGWRPQFPTYVQGVPDVLRAMGFE